MKTTTFSDQVTNFILGRDMEQLKNLTLKDITMYFGVSKVYLIKKFKDQKGITPGKFILREKMIRANSLMEKNHDLTVNDLADMVGFSTADYFIRVFKEQMGLAPCTYRTIKRVGFKGIHRENPAGKKKIKGINTAKFVTIMDA